MSATKAFAAAALDRAEAAARRATEPVHLGRRSSSLPVRNGAIAVSSGSAATLPPWDPLGPKDRVARMVRGSSELRDLDGVLRQRRSHEEHLESLDRMIMDTEQTRALIASICGGQRALNATKPEPLAPPLQHARAPVRHGGMPQDAVPSASSSTGSPNASAVGKLAPLSLMPALQSPSAASTETLSTSTPTAIRSAPAGVRASTAKRPAARVIELRPTPCQAETAGVDCACCLCPLVVGESMLTFPCPARHAFHASCLQSWLKAAGSRTTCPMCRGWPRPAASRAVAASGGKGAAR
eukprot:gnl/TRDRNA2_/TRDRNA2_191042_c0_seq1.p1 gnl/TRDRNA2_/TRDRNA2_191042_c0~~gnl/TRDRNA2_/TRDRNA2_191042_c0_seq1.p1  ORF type:complete len:297 (-),score=36.40 gnl/TRDRNA2_/TRDRNA2_191042_c0_seq1:110-1000(-)